MVNIMRRFFIAQHPTYGSAKNPVKWRLEESPYYWWWVALTKNSRYIDCCNRGGKGKLAKLYKELGDVRYEGNRLKAFVSWWTHEMSSGEKRGVYLFAEPVLPTYLGEFENHKALPKKWNKETQMIISIPLTISQKQIRRLLDRILKKRHSGTIGRNKGRSIDISEARYKLACDVHAKRLKKQFDLLDLYEEGKRKGEKVRLYDLAVKVNLGEISTRTLKDEPIQDEAAKRRVQSSSASRYLKRARDIVDNVDSGVFPVF